MNIYMGKEVVYRCSPHQPIIKATVTDIHIIVVGDGETIRCGVTLTNERTNESVTVGIFLLMQWIAWAK